MKQASVADLRNKFRKVAAWIENGEEVQIVKRGRKFARLVPENRIAAAKKTAVDWAAQLKAIWGDKVFTDAEVQAMRDAEDET